VTGEASERDLLVLHWLACAVTFAAAASLGAPAVALALVSLAIGRAYSLEPVALSYRTWLAPVVLGVAYVLVPYGLGVAVRGVALRSADALLAGALFLLFLARIVLRTSVIAGATRRKGDRPCSCASTNKLPAW